MAFADVGTTRLFFTDEGRGDPPLLFVHGYTCDSHDWSWQLPHFAATRRLIALDLRGHGRSSTPDDGYTVVEFTEDLVGLLDHLSVDRVVAIGHSLGGVIVSALAVEHPERVEAVVGVDPAYLLADDTRDNLAPVLDLLDTEDPVPIVQQVIGGGEAPGASPALRTWQRRRVAGMSHHVLRLVLQSQMGGLALYSNSAPYLSQRQCPVLTFYTDTGRCAVEEALFADQRSRSIAWEGAGHWLHQERPAEFNAVVEEWLASLSP